ncbi:MAG TPA: DNA-directed RNA polymerase subunit L [Thermoproteales archaeon]|mgnify:CR=1 FL=1|nr:DNA-directed RNA polymerase subunit L [Thermoproteales archaeon]
MEIRIVKEEENVLEFELPSEDHTFCNLLVNILNKNPHVEFAAYKIEHPLVGVPRIYVRTDGSVKPREVLVEASKQIESIYTVIKDNFIKSLNAKKKSNPRKS